VLASRSRWWSLLQPRWERPQVKAAREARIVAMTAEIEAGKREPVKPRHPAEVLIASVTAADDVMRQLQQDLARGELTPAMSRAYGEWVDRTGRLAKLALDTSIAERLVEIQERPTRLLVDQLERVLRGVFADPRVSVERGTESQIILAALHGLDPDGTLTELPALPGAEPIEGEVVELDGAES
jgi:hypothetical protein